MSVEAADFEAGLLEPLPSLEALLRAGGRRVDDLHGVRVGSLRGVLVDAGSGAPTWGIVKLGRFGRCSAVPAAYLAPGADRVWAALSRDPIRSAATLDPSSGLTVAEERMLLAHYGVPRALGRQLELASRPDEEASSAPA